MTRCCTLQTGKLMNLLCGDTNLNARRMDSFEAEWPRGDSPEPSRSAQHLLVLSARDKEALRGVCYELSAQLERDNELSLADVAFTLQVARPAYPWRKCVIAQSNAEACERLRDQAPSGRCGDEPSDLVFMFPGQGVQYLGMAEPLYRTEALFREAFDGCAQIVSRCGGPDLHGILLRKNECPVASRVLNGTEVCEPALFAVEYALSGLLASWGIRPSAMIGYGLGEYVAACVSGVLGLEDALKIVVLRGRLLQRAPQSRMLAINLPRETAELYVGSPCSIAAVNGPSSCLACGPSAALSGIVRALERDGVSWRLLSTKGALHSPLLDTAAEELRSAFENVRFGPVRVPYLSNVTGNWITDALATSVDYWLRHLRHTVEFWEGLRSLESLPHKILVEVGPGTMLSSLARKTPLMSEVPTVALDRAVRAGGSRPMLDAVGRIWCAGGVVDWQAFNAGECHRLVPLPSYPRKRTPGGESQGTSGLALAGVTPNEAVVARIWRALLGTEQVGPDDDFLDLGGDSLLLEQVARELESSCGRAVCVRDLMHHPTVAGMARLLDA
jgi:phthiocerol/phenolphthiocerol synthesis type-I polyketide synthase E